MVAGSLICLIILFLTSSHLDHLIQGITLIFYTTATFTMGIILNISFKAWKKPLKSNESEKTDISKEVLTSRKEGEAATCPSSLHTDNTSAAKRQQPSILFLTKQDQVARTMQQQLSVWGHVLHIANSCAKAIQLILNLSQRENGTQQVTLLVDTQGLEMDPIQLPALIHNEAELATLKLIGILAGQQNNRTQQLMDAGYSAVISKPIDKSELFSLITTQKELTDTISKVVNLAHFRQKSNYRNRKRILLADQRTADRERIASLLLAAGHRVKLVENGEMALDALEYQRFDVALINLHLPIMNGTQVIKLHRFTTPHPEWASFIVMTDQTTPATLKLCRDLQVKACLFKPVPTSALLEIIDSIPAISHPVSAMIEHFPNNGASQQETQFLHADLLDTRVLEALEQLDNNSGFVPDLISIFGRDSIAILQGMEEAAECQDAKRFIELSSILLDNAGQLGAFALYEMCMTLQQMSQRELNATLASKLARLREIIVRTNMAFQHYLKEREAQYSDQS
jgi:two-component system sensor histidine kinase RpfC